MLLLEPQHVFGAGDIRTPQILIMILSIPSAIFGGQVIDIVELHSTEDRVHLLKDSDIGL